MKKFLARTCPFILAFVFLAAGQIRAQQVKSIVRHDTLAVGDTLQYIIVTKQGTDVDKVVFPDSTGFGSWFGVKDRRIYRASANSDSAVFTLQFFGVRDTMIQSLDIGFVTGNDTLTKTTLPLPIHFKSQIKDTTNAAFKPLKPIYLFALSILPYIIGIVVVLVIAYILYRMYKRWQKEQEKPEEIPAVPRKFEDPLELLETELSRLRNDESLQQRAFKVFYSKLGDILRAYFERLYNIPALESTSRELQRDLDSLGVDSELKQYTRNILRQADMVKFAKFSPTLDQAHNDLEYGMKFLERARMIDRERVEQERALFEEEIRKEKEEEEKKRKERQLEEQPDENREEETANPSEKE